MTPLRQRMLEDMSIRNLAENTQQSYVQQVSSFARYFACSPEAMGPEKVREYQVHLVEDCKLAPSSISIAVSALRFLYKVTLKQPWSSDDIPMPKKPFKLPVILSREEVMQFLDSVANLKHRTILTTAYAAGLRVSEAAHLRVDGNTIALLRTGPTDSIVAVPTSAADLTSRLASHLHPAWLRQAEPLTMQR